MSIQQFKRRTHHALAAHANAAIAVSRVGGPTLNRAASCTESPGTGPGLQVQGRSLEKRSLLDGSSLSHNTEPRQGFRESAPLSMRPLSNEHSVVGRGCLENASNSSPVPKCRVRLTRLQFVLLEPLGKFAPLLGQGVPHFRRARLRPAQCREIRRGSARS
jgi:hypothetical protein